ncbi:hypothetical protein BDY19DRAFT_565791 [Irpex rosettiformis]|uniref:Uncharacterized protein n=1 Tax=Irpex rosettiformis TaxID=378272 RepID=A0ACB8UC39_9APHY|nr:hypothetical protein BDY19DRAFT_565791 [Irpex rosettiformis]
MPAVLHHLLAIALLSSATLNVLSRTSHQPIYVLELHLCLMGELCLRRSRRRALVRTVYTRLPLASLISSQQSVQKSCSSVSNPLWPEDDDEGHIWSRQEYETIRAGKQPERSVWNTAPTEDTQKVIGSTDVNAISTLETDTNDWYGLEETLEISMRECMRSNSSTCSDGEFSKSFESWLVMHNGYVHPHSAQQEYRRWRNWHKRLDLETQSKERILRTFQFLRDSKKMADVYVEEWYRRDWFECNKAIHSDTTDYESTSRMVQSDLAALSSCRPDPYFPAIKHNLAWVLKTSRSSSCLRELRPPPKFA